MNSHLQKNKLRAFTIIELLVAIVIIGILATLTIISYAGIVDRTYVAVVKSDLAANDKKAKAYQVQYGTFPTAVDANYCPSAPTVDKNYCFQKSGATTFTFYSGTASTYSLTMGPSDTSSSKPKYYITQSLPATIAATFALRLQGDGGGCYDPNSCDDFGNNLIQTSDGGLAIVGSVNSGDSLSFNVCSTGGCSSVGDALIAKFNSNGNLAWASKWDNGNGSPQTGEPQPSETNNLIQLSDGSYVAAGYTKISGISNNDAILFKVNSSGIHQWTTRWGGSSNDQANSIISTADGGFLIVGDTQSYGNGSQDSFLAKFDSSGTLTWSRTIGSAGTVSDSGNSVVAVSDGYVLAGQTNNSTPYIAKFNLIGTLQWSTTWPASGSASSIYTTSDGGFVVSGTTSSYGVGGDAYIAKFTSTGTLSWLTIWGGSGSEQGIYAQQTLDGGYVLSGSTASYGSGGQDAFIAKFDSSGLLSWSRTVGDTGTDYSNSVSVLSDGGYAITGLTYSVKYKLLLARFDSTGAIVNCSSSICRTISASSSQPAVSSSVGSLTSTSPTASSSVMSTSSTYMTTITPTITYIAQ